MNDIKKVTQRNMKIHTDIHTYYNQCVEKGRGPPGLSTYGGPKN